MQKCNINMKRVGNNQWPLMFDALLDGGRASEKWPQSVRATFHLSMRLTTMRVTVN